MHHPWLSLRNWKMWQYGCMSSLQTRRQRFNFSFKDKPWEIDFYCLIVHGCSYPIFLSSVSFIGGNNKLAACDWLKEKKGVTRWCCSPLTFPCFSILRVVKKGCYLHSPVVYIFFNDIPNDVTMSTPVSSPNHLDF